MINNQSREKALLEIIRQGLEVSGEREAQVTLGNRSDYLGLSELARYGECPRAVLLAKIFPQSNSLNRLLTLQRGHWFENGLAACFRNLELKFLSQLEISITNEGTPIRGHFDFTLVWDKPYPAVRIVEVKSTDKLPTQPYPAHIFQAQAQVNLLAQFWNEPVFNLKDSTGALISQNSSFPQICKQNLGIYVPDNPASISVESWLLCLSMCDAVCFGPYKHDEDSLTDMLAMAEDCWAQYSQLRHDSLAINNLPYAQGFNPLCGYCEFNMDCPKFHDADNMPQWETTLDKLDSLKEQRSIMDTEIKETEEVLKLVYRQSGQKDWLIAGKHRFRLARVNGRQSLNIPLLREELDCLFDNYDISDTADDLLNRCVKIGTTSERLTISPVNRQVA